MRLERKSMTKVTANAPNKAAAKTLDEVREAMKINYFNDAALIQQQAEMYRNK